MLFIETNAADTPDTGWLQTAWNGEPAMASTSHGWKAIVSLQRGRLMHFGPADRELNLLLAPPTRSNSNLLGGHRLWLGPQQSWNKIWPPPKEWELSEPASFTTEAEVLRLVMPSTHDDWPQLTRTYRWDGGRLICGAEIHGGNRAAQIIQIFQVPSSTTVEASAQADSMAPQGYVLLPAGPSPQYATDFSPPPHVTRQGNDLTLRHLPELIIKPGFRPQPLTGRNGAFTLLVSRGTQTGAVAAEPDHGFFTQVYLGGREPLIELEQLSPAFAPGTPASFSVVLEGRAP